MFVTHIPKSATEVVSINISLGESIFIVGANGTGKSSLMHRFFISNSANASRISAHRQNWFPSSSVSFSSGNKRQTETQIKTQDTNAEARWKDDYSPIRPSIAIYDLIDAENSGARAIAEAVRQKDMVSANKLLEKDSPLKVLNELLRLSNIPIEVSVHSNDEVLARRRGGQSYSVAELSDGERNALLIAASVLTVPSGTLLLIDEPERHLHRSIISPLLCLLFSRRQDCAFVISTHEISLPIDTPSARTLLLRDCTYSGKNVSSWDFDLLESSVEVNEDVKYQIVGARKKMLFVEGQTSSLDSAIYSIVFPQASVLPKSSCREVMNAVKGVRAAEQLLWLKAYGIIDRDGRTQEDVNELNQVGIYPLSVFSVESIYYHPELMRRVSDRRAELVGGADAHALVTSATEQAISIIREHGPRLAQRVLEHKLRDDLERAMPSREELAAGKSITICLNVPQLLANQISAFDDCVSRKDLIGLVSNYPIRETGALATIATCLGFKNRMEYEAAVRKLLLDDSTAVDFVRTLFGVLNDEI